MVTISRVIEDLQLLKNLHGDVEVKIVNYHSDYRDDSIDNLVNAVTCEGSYVLIGGESF